MNENIKRQRRERQREDPELDMAINQSLMDNLGILGNISKTIIYFFIYIMITRVFQYNSRFSK